ncbi:hypothetical protein CFP75_10310 [Amycolatopsis alba DSM 44262]|uniref:Uncharacterized protein n=1 Tax=Amycolatopsis alba DSM 44262 TaxID=1125972 RepID=A0A229S0U0_AMYAL|nr:hypothetical protein CFP75_10310 [Amycolatopsis alba DSM 44262]
MLPTVSTAPAKFPDPSCCIAFLYSALRSKGTSSGMEFFAVVAAAADWENRLDARYAPSPAVSAHLLTLEKKFVTALAPSPCQCSPSLLIAALTALLKVFSELPWLFQSSPFSSMSRGSRSCVTMFFRSPCGTAS